MNSNRYERTLREYQRVFRESPPATIWPRLQKSFSIKILSTGFDMNVEVKPSTVMRSIFEEYSRARGADPRSGPHQFFWRGNLLRNQDTIEQLGIEAGNRLDAVYVKASTEESRDLTIKIRGALGEQVLFKIKSNTKLWSVFRSYAKHSRIGLEVLTFLLDGQYVDGDSTANDLELEHGSEIDACLPTGLYEAEIKQNLCRL